MGSYSVLHSERFTLLHTMINISDLISITSYEYYLLRDEAIIIWVPSRWAQINATLRIKNMALAFPFYCIIKFSYLIYQQHRLSLRLEIGGSKYLSLSALLCYQKLLEFHSKVEKGAISYKNYINCTCKKIGNISSNKRVF
jgi:hypothetical protein